MGLGLDQQAGLVVPQVLVHRPGGLVATLAIVFDGPQGDGFQLVRNLRVHRTRGRGYRLGHLQHRLLGLGQPGPFGPLTYEHFIQEQTQPVHVRPNIQVVAVIDLLRGHVQRRTRYAQKQVRRFGNVGLGQAG